MLIGELAQKSGLSRDTIRFYEKQGLIEVGRKERRFNNYKEYSPQTLQRLLSIKHLKGFGFTLNEAAEFLQMIEDKQASCENVSLKIAEKVMLIEQKIAELNELKSLMVSAVSRCLDTSQLQESGNCPILSTNIRA